MDICNLFLFTIQAKEKLLTSFGMIQMGGL